MKNEIPIILKGKFESENLEEAFLKYLEDNVTNTIREKVKEVIDFKVKNMLFSITGDSYVKDYIERSIRKYLREKLGEEFNFQSLNFRGFVKEIIKEMFIDHFRSALGNDFDLFELVKEAINKTNDSRIYINIDLQK